MHSERRRAVFKPDAYARHCGCWGTGERSDQGVSEAFCVLFFKLIGYFSDYGLLCFEFNGRYGILIYDISCRRYDHGG